MKPKDTPERRQELTENGAQLPAFLKNKHGRLVLVGDDRQLPAFTQIQWGIVPLQKACGMSVHSRLLGIQRRQTALLGGNMSQIFYEGRVGNADNCPSAEELGHHEMLVVLWPDAQTQLL